MLCRSQYPGKGGFYTPLGVVLGIVYEKAAQVSGVQMLRFSNVSQPRSIHKA